MGRLVIYPKDIQYFLGEGERQSQLTYNHLLSVYNKNRKQKITIKEFCSYYRLDEEEVKKSIHNFEKGKLK